MKKLTKRVCGLFMAMVLVFGMAPVGALTASATNAATQSTYTTGSIINYGSYPQTRVTDSGLIAALNAQTLGANSTVSYGGSKYKRVYFTQYTPYYTTGTPNASNSYQDDNGYYINTIYWFKYEPIQWRVLSNVGGELFVMAEKILESRAYNQVLTNITWETCTMRSWLNGEFYNTAFNTTEQSKIKTSTVINENNPNYGTNGGNNTNDKLFLLSWSEVTNPAYGFSSSYSNNDTARRAQGSDFAKSNGLWVSMGSSYLGNSMWWLRTPGSNLIYACPVTNAGRVYDDHYSVSSTYVGVRPALKLHLTSDIFTSDSRVTDIKVVSPSSSSVRITWAPLANATGYVLYRSDTLHGSYLPIADVEFSFYTDTKLVTGREYYYKIRAYKISDASVIFGSFSEVHRAQPYPTDYATFFNMVDSAEPSIPIPGLTTQYVPQGICEDENNIYISAYYKKKKNEGTKKNSKIYILDKHTGNLKKTLFVQSEAHFGGLTIVGNNLWITRGKGFLVIPLATVSSKTDGSTIALSECYTADVSKTLKGNASFCYYDGTVLWVGTFKENSRSQMDGYEIGTAAGGTFPLRKKYSMNIPKQIQGCVRLKDGRFVLSASWGRNNNSKIYVTQDVIKNNRTGLILKIFISTLNSQVITAPPMSEGLSLTNKQGLRVLFESGADCYYGNPGAYGLKTKCPYPFFQVPTIKLSGIASKSVNGITPDSPGKAQSGPLDLAVPNREKTAAITGHCGENAAWSLDLNLNELEITGTGEMFNFDPSENDPPPWEDYKTIIRTVTIAEGIETIGDNAFSNLASLAEITIPASVITIGQEAFSGCTALTTLTGATGVSSIGNRTFSDCVSMTEFYLPESVTAWGEDVFLGCENLSAIYVNPANEHFSSFDGVLTDKDQLSILVCPEGFTGDSTLPDTAISIADNAFANCAALTSLHIPESMETIGDNAFWGCGAITELFIPKNVSSIGAHAFTACDNLVSIEVCEDNAEYSSSDGCLYSKDGEDLLRYPEGKRGAVVVSAAVTGFADDVFFGCREYAIAGFTGSVAQAYAAEQEIDFHAIVPGLNIVALPIKQIYSRGESLDLSGLDLRHCGPDNTLTKIDSYSVTGFDSTMVGTQTITLDFESENISFPVEVRNTPVLASEHPYANNANLSWQYTHPGNAQYMDIVFSEKTKTEAENDIITILDRNGNRVGEYSGEDLTGRTISLPGNSFTIHLDTDDSITDFGFEIAEVIAHQTMPAGVFNESMAWQFDVVEGTLYLSGAGDMEVFEEGTAPWHNYRHSVKTVCFGSGIHAIEPLFFNDFSALNDIRIDEENPVYTSVDGVLYNKDETSLIVCPRNKAGSLVLPESLQSIENLAFFNCVGITQVYVPPGVVMIHDRAFDDNYNGTMLGQSESFAEQFANANGFVFIHPGLNLCELPERNVFSVGEPLDLHGLKLFYCDTDLMITEVDEYEVAGYNPHLTGAQEIRLLYASKEVGFSITVGDALISSSHPYENGKSIEYTYNAPDSTGYLELTFSRSTDFEAGSDYIRLVDGAGTLVGEYTGTELADRKIIVFNPSFTLTLVSDEDVSAYGFDVCIQAKSGQVSGACGENALWSFERSTGMLIISGTGAMEEYRDWAGNEAPWATIKDYIVSVAIEEGITGIGSCAFAGIEGLRNLIVPRGVYSIGDGAFRGCLNLETVFIPNTVTEIGNQAFSGVDGVLIYGVPGSMAEDYAKENAIGFTPYVAAANDTDVIIDYTKMLIFGIEIGTGSFDEILNIGEGCEARYFSSPNGFGTGAKTAISLNGIILDTFTVVIFGDITGDGNIDSNDEGMAIDYENWRVNWDPVTDAAFLMAGDLNGDGNIDSIDADLMAEVENWNMVIDQTTGRASAVVDDIEFPESDHPYSNNMDETWHYTHPRAADSLSITFSQETEVESGCDYLYIYDGDGNLIGQYNGTGLAGQTITVPGNTFSIRLTSDGSVTSYGFSIDSIVAG